MSEGVAAAGYPLPVRGGRPALPGMTGAAGAALRDPGGAQNAFEALLLGELLKPLQDALQSSGLFPRGAPGDIYAHFWKVHLSEILARDIDLLPNVVPPRATDEIQQAAAARAYRPMRPETDGQLPGTSATFLPLSPAGEATQPRPPGS